MVINDVTFMVGLADIIKELKLQLKANNIDLLDKVKDTNSDLMVSCPFHRDGKERRPSAGIRKSDGQFHCFACGKVCSLPEVVSYCFGRIDGGVFGWTWLLKNFISVNFENRKGIELDYSRDGTKKNVEYVTEEELDSYRYYHPYMYKRKLTDEIIELFDVGYDKNTNCITFPVRDINGNCLFIARRNVDYKFFNYPKDVKKSVYGLYELYKTGIPNAVIICESMLDALTCWVYGEKAVALNGLGDDNQIQQLRELPCREFILATDNDVAGQKARKNLRKKLSNKLITEFVLPENRKDINELSNEEFNNLLKIF